MEKMILCGILFDSTSHEIKKNKAIIIKDNIIIKIVDMKNISNINRYEVFDLSNNFVMPGLIDAHVHINMNGEIDSDKRFLYESLSTITLNSLKNVQSDLLAGYTTIRDVGSIGFSDVAIKRAINSHQYWGPRMLVSGWSISPPGGSSDSKCFNDPEGFQAHGKIVNGVSEVLKVARENFKYGADFLKLMITNSDGYMDMTYEEILAATRIAKAHNSTIAAHASGVESIKNAVNAGVTSIEHGSLIDEEGAKLMKEKGTFLVPTLIATSTRHRRKDLRISDSRQTDEEYKKIKDAMSMYKEMGVKICFGSDAAIPYISHGNQGDEFKLLVDYGLSNSEALMSATKNNSELLQWANKVGTIEEGKYADIVAFNGNPLIDITIMNNSVFVMKDGTVYKNKNN